MTAGPVPPYAGLVGPSLPPAIDLTLPPELVELQWLEVELVTTAEILVEDPQGQHHVCTADRLVDEPGSKEIATRNRWSVEGIAVGGHRDLGPVTYAAGAEPWTHIAVVIAYTPWKATP